MSPAGARSKGRPQERPFCCPRDPIQRLRIPLPPAPCAQTGEAEGVEL